LNEYYTAVKNIAVYNTRNVNNVDRSSANNTKSFMASVRFEYPHFAMGQTWPSKVNFRTLCN
jgi:hypothetical protein